MTGSLAYRKNEAAILRGVVPEKYTRLLPHIPGDRVLEIGSAEGVLALLLARAGKTVAALERSRERHDGALNLAAAWAPHFQSPAPAFACGDILDRLDLLDGIDTLVAVRMIYYLREDLDTVFAEVAAKIPNVVLCGNANRARWWFEGVPDKHGGPVNYYAASAGMRDLLTRHGYAIVHEVLDGDPIVVGRRD